MTYDEPDYQPLPMSDEKKLHVIIGLIKDMSPEFKDAVVGELLKHESPRETTVHVSSDDALVRIDLGRPLAWFAIPKEHALQLGMLLMQHAGATLAQVERPKPNAS